MTKQSRVVHYFNFGAKLVWITGIAALVGIYGYRRWSASPATYSARPASIQELQLARTGGRVIGDGPTELVFFSRYSCPFSAAFWKTALELQEKHKLSIRIRHLVHSQDSLSYLAALGATCVDSSESMEVYHSLMFDRFIDGLEGVFAVASLSGVQDINAFENCIRSDAASTRVAKDYQDGIDLGIPGVPAVFLADQLIVGSLPAADLAVLAQKK